MHENRIIWFQQVSIGVSIVEFLFWLLTPSARWFFFLFFFPYTFFSFSFFACMNFCLASHLPTPDQFSNGSSLVSSTMTSCMDRLEKIEPEKNFKKY